VDIGAQDRLREELLVVRCQLGERAAFEELIRAWSAPLLSHMRRVAGEGVADDLAQEVWIKVLRGISGLREGAKLRPWLFGIAHHVMMDHLRLRYAGRIACAAEESAPDEDDTGREEILTQLESELAALPIIERESLTLFYLEELSVAEIAAIQAVPPGTVKSRLHRARGMLRDRMMSQGVKT
jgi:RNA polymerase sigma-70 factor (ECF subfamily)